MITIELDLETLKDLVTPPGQAFDKAEIVALATRLSMMEQQRNELKAEVKSLQSELNVQASRAMGSFEMQECIKHIVAAASGGERIRAIKYVRQITGLDLRGSKDLVEAALAEGKMNLDLIQAKKDGTHPIYNHCPVCHASV